MAYINIDTNTGDTGLATLTLFVGSRHFTFVLDTGSNISHLAKETLKLLPKVNYLSLEGESTSGISGKVVSEGKIRQCFNSGMFTFEQDFQVTDLSKIAGIVKESGNFTIHGILGTDFLRKYSCHLDYKKHRLHLE